MKIDLKGHNSLTFEVTKTDCNRLSFKSLNRFGGIYTAKGREDCICYNKKGRIILTRW